MNTRGITYSNKQAEGKEQLKEALDQYKRMLDFGINEPDEEKAKEKMDANIYAKLQSGKPLTQKEMEYLRKYNPVLYAQALRIEYKRKALENQLKNADSKEEVQEIYGDALAMVREEDPAKQYVVAAIQETVKEFKKTDEYKKLPETEKEAERKEKSSSGGITYEFGENSYQMAFADEDTDISTGFMAVS